MKKIYLAFLIFLSGCASQNVETYWEKPGASGQDFYTDRSQCNAQAFGIPNATLIQIAIVQNQCLRGKGWYTVEKSR